MLLQNAFKVKIKNVEGKIPDITNLATNTTFNVEINQVKNKIPNIRNLATTTVLTAEKNKKPDQNKYITTRVNSREFCFKISTRKICK